MDVYLIPFARSRHLAMACWLAGAGLLVWWGNQAWHFVGVPGLFRTFHMLPERWLDGALFLGSLAAVVAAGSLYGEGRLVGRSRVPAVGWALVAGGVAALLALCAQALAAGGLSWLASAAWQAPLRDPSWVTLRFHAPAWVGAGIGAGVGSFVARRLHAAASARWPWAGRDRLGAPEPRTGVGWLADAWAHGGGGAVAGLTAACVWHLLGPYSRIGGDLYAATAAASMVFGGVHGALCWGVPSFVYAGWIRVLGSSQSGARVRLGTVRDAGEERFVGSYPLGLDVTLPPDGGVAELHVSVVVRDDGTVVARGLSDQPTEVVRALERVALHYDPERAAPLETELRQEDRIRLGSNTEVEFVWVPRGPAS